METWRQGGGEAHVCERCGQRFPTREELNLHKQERHSDPTDTAAPRRTDGARTGGGGGLAQSDQRAGSRSSLQLPTGWLYAAWITVAVMARCLNRMSSRS
jgi:hypothetical protein